MTTVLPIDRTAAGPAPSLADRAYQELRDRLVMLDIAPGQPIHESQLMDELGMGRTPVREALKRLEGDHLVVSYPRRGTFASPVDITELSKISELRRVLEPFAARRAAELTGAGVRAEMERTLAGLRREDLASAGSRRDLMALDMRVHRLIYEATGNDYLAQTLGRFDDLATRIWCMTLDRLPGVTDHIIEHVDLLQAVLDGRPEDAERLSAEHIVSFEKALREAL